MIIRKIVFQFRLKFLYFFIHYFFIIFFFFFIKNQILTCIDSLGMGPHFVLLTSFLPKHTQYHFDDVIQLGLDVIKTLLEC